LPIHIHWSAAECYLQAVGDEQLTQTDGQ